MQNKVKEFNKQVKQFHKKPVEITARLLDIGSELGELNKEVLKATKYGTKEFGRNDDFDMELGDVLYAILSLCEEVGVSAENCLDLTLQKMKTRLNNNSNLASGN